MIPIHHLLEREPEDDGDVYAPPSLAAEGFIHCTRGPDEVLATATRHFAHATRLVVWVIDPVRVRAPIVDEPAPGRPGSRYPHVYGPLNRDAIVARRVIARDADGSWSWVT